jgi:hypothetical protein
MLGFVLVQGRPAPNPNVRNSQYFSHSSLYVVALSLTPRIEAACGERVDAYHGGHLVANHQQVRRRDAEAFDGDGGVDSESKPR